MIIINTKNTHVPVKIGDLEFKFDISDDGIKRLEKNHQKISVFLGGVEEDGFSLKDNLEYCFDLLLGSGSFEKIYEQTPSTSLCADYLLSLSSGLEEEIKVIVGDRGKNKYLNGDGIL